MVLVWAPGWYLTYHYWPTAYNRHIFEGTLYFVPAKTARDRMRQELAAVTFKEFGLQDCNTLEATQTMLESRVVVPISPSATRRSSCATSTRRPTITWTAYQEQRDPPHVADASGADSAGRRDRQCRPLPPEFADLEPFADWALPTERERYAKRLSSTMDELQAFYDAALPRLEDAARISSSSPSTPCPRTPRACCSCATR